MTQKKFRIFWFESSLLIAMLPRNSKFLLKNRLQVGNFFKDKKSWNSLFEYNQDATEAMSIFSRSFLFEIIIDKKSCNSRSKISSKTCGSSAFNLDIDKIQSKFRFFFYLKARCLYWFSWFKCYFWQGRNWTITRVFLPYVRFNWFGICILKKKEILGTILGFKVGWHITWSNQFGIFG